MRRAGVAAGVLVAVLGGLAASLWGRGEPEALADLPPVRRVSGPPCQGPAPTTAVVIRPPDPSQVIGAGAGSIPAGTPRPEERRDKYGIRETGHWVLPLVAMDEILPTDIRRGAKLTDAEAAAVHRVLAEIELPRLTADLRALAAQEAALFAERMPAVTPEERQAKGAADLCADFAAACHYELGLAVSAETEAEWRQRLVERRPLTELVGNEGCLARWAATMHAARRDSLAALGKELRPEALDALRQRYLPDGVFAFRDGRRFDFGRDPGAHVGVPVRGR